MNTIETNNSYNGFLYEIKDSSENTKGYLLGTVHFSNTSDIILNKKIEDAFNRCNKLYIETNPELATEYVIRAAPIEYMRKLTSKVPLNYAVWITQIEQQIFEKFNKGIENKLIEESKSRGLFIGQLENMYDQAYCSAAIKIDAYNALNPEKQREFQVLSEEEINNIDKTPHIKKISDEINELIEQYKCGNSHFFKEVFKSESPEFYKTMKLRNEIMVEQMCLALKNTVPRFFAVGSSHLFDSDQFLGMVSLLREKGWTVKRIKTKNNINYPHAD